MADIPDVYYHLGARLNRFRYKFPLIEDYLLLLMEIFTPEEADIGARIPAELTPLPDLSSRLGIPAGELAGRLEQMAGKGLLFSRDREGQTEYCAIPIIPGIIEFQLMRAERTPREKKFAAMLEEFETKFAPLVTPELMESVKDKLPDPFARVIPVQEEVTSLTEVFPYERVREMVAQSDFFAAGRCFCRYQAELLDRPCRVEHVPEWSCMSFGDVARFSVKWGFARELTREEALETLEACERAGLVHCTNNVSDLVTFICNCCSCCCGIFRAIKNFHYPGAVAHSNFIIHSSPDNCTGCGECIERCPVDALSLEEDTVRSDLSRCIGCGLCVQSCPADCLTLVRRSETVEPARAQDPFIGIMGDQEQE